MLSIIVIIGCILRILEELLLRYHKGIQNYARFHIQEIFENYIEDSTRMYITLGSCIFMIILAIVCW